MTREERELLETIIAEADADSAKVLAELLADSKEVA